MTSPALHQRSMLEWAWHRFLVDAREMCRLWDLAGLAEHLLWPQSWHLRVCELAKCSLDKDVVVYEHGPDGLRLPA
eukprot:CAMPEP_0177537830 /NCGR_PEP_ID=MMETSP0369-20130122/58006_1 /TAXON_ID=447022 ORGANISM="Scrippsiella hangoei-like, Strain SHHI-4" /NCGR_SAMPLE_ID=MMETSP0369 /ASSEMBLY_ACC=CAM_ASM_000364 /LENGTH=75 /DNA_ID=CAMNT_0019020507 /DNA_START=164 /DNA_END=391 /DNA_ORIENTATION=+